MNGTNSPKVCKQSLKLWQQVIFPRKPLTFPALSSDNKKRILILSQPLVFPCTALTAFDFPADTVRCWRTMWPNRKWLVERWEIREGRGRRDMERAGEREDARMCGKTQANRKRQQWKTQSLFGKVNKSFISKRSKSKKLSNTFLIFKIIKAIFVKISTCSGKTAGGVN